jgi:hypothetical protein
MEDRLEEEERRLQVNSLTCFNYHLQKIIYFKYHRSCIGPMDE